MNTELKEAKQQAICSSPGTAYQVGRKTPDAHKEQQSNERSEQSKTGRVTGDDTRSLTGLCHG